jgi:hypothetical protein
VKKNHLSEVENDPFLTSKEVCDWLRITPRTLHRRRHDRRIIGVPTNERVYLYRKSAILKYLALAEAGAFAPNATGRNTDDRKAPAR